MAMNGQSAAGPSTSTPRWQAVMAALSLLSLTTLVLLPMAFLALGVWGLVLGVASAWSLDVVGVKGTSALKDAVAIAVALFGVAGAITAVEATVAGILKIDGWRKSRMTHNPQQRVAFHPPKRPTSWKSFLFEHPWYSLGAVSLIFDGCVAPFHASHAIHLPPALLGGFIVAGATLLFLFVVALGLRVSYSWMRSLWQGVRQSPFFAGLVTAGSLLASATVLLIGHAFVQAASGLYAPETARAIEACAGSADCTRRVLVDAIAGQPRAPASLPAAPYTAEERSSFDACVEEIHRKGSDGLSARQSAYWQAKFITKDELSADDVVHDAIMAVCLSTPRIRNVVPYFIRAVQNAAKREWRRGRRYCSLVIEEPNWSPNFCVQENASPEVWNETLWMEASANDALCGLAADDRKIIEWYVWDGLSHAQIAAKLRITEVAARQKFSRARRNLKDKFDERCQ